MEVGVGEEEESDLEFGVFATWVCKFGLRRVKTWVC